MNAPVKHCAELYADTDARLEVYKSLCKSQQQALEAYERTIDEIEWLCEGRVDIDNNGGPNLAMQIMQAIRGERP